MDTANLCWDPILRGADFDESMYTTICADMGELLMSSSPGKNLKFHRGGRVGRHLGKVSLTGITTHL